MKIEVLEFFFISGYMASCVLAVTKTKSQNRDYLFAFSLLLSYLSTAALFSPMLANMYSSITSDGIVETQYLMWAMLVALIIYAPIILLLLAVAIHYESKAATEVVLPPTLD